MSETANTVLRVGFAGTPDFAVRVLEQLIASEFRPVVVYTQPDRPAGRGHRLRPSAVKVRALENHLELCQPSTWRDPDVISQLASFDLDVLIVAAYGLILPSAVLSTPRTGCINVHASVLPRWRGAAPIERAIMAGDEMSGVSIMQMNEGLDTGPVICSATHPIKPDTTGPVLDLHLAELGGKTLLTALRAQPAINALPQPDEGVCYATKLKPTDAHINWQADAIVIHRQIRALTGRMPAYTFIDGTRMRVLEAELDESTNSMTPGEIVEVSKLRIRVGCGSGSVQVTRVQLARGKGRPLTVAQAINGYPGLFTTGTRFTE